MGYEHYWERKPKLEISRFQQAVNDCEIICKLLDIPLGNADGVDSPVFNDNIIIFNGLDYWSDETDNYDENVIGSHEPFELSRVSPDSYSDSCKTEALPYDLNVMCCLIIFNHYFANDFLVSSDGQSSEWDNARNKCEQYLGYGKQFQLSDL